MLGLDPFAFDGLNTNISFEAGELVISWDTKMGITYVIEKSSDLQVWEPILDSVTVGTGNEFQFAWTTTADCYFFRVISQEIDSDSDGLSDYEEFLLGTDIELSDTDGDEQSDLEEFVNGSSPLINNLPIKILLQEGQSENFNFHCNNGSQNFVAQLSGGAERAIYQSEILQLTNHELAERWKNVPSDATPMARFEGSSSLPHPFPFYGIYQSKLYYSSNGVLGFRGVSASRAPFELPVYPSLEAPLFSIAPLWAEITNSESVEKFLFRDSQCSVIDFLVRATSDGSVKRHFQVQLLDSGEIHILYNEVQSVPARSGLVGIQNIDASSGLTVSYSNERNLSQSVVELKPSQTMG